MEDKEIKPDEIMDEIRQNEIKTSEIELTDEMLKELSNGKGADEDEE